MSRGPLQVTARCALALIAFAGCSHHPVAPHIPTPTLRTIWPNENGRAWSYQVVDRTFTGGRDLTTYVSREDVPAAPTMTQVAGLLDTLPAGDVSQPDTASFGLRFSGLITTGSGVTRQNLVETLITRSAPLAARGGIRAPAVFLAQLYRARPDLRPLLRSRLASVALPADTLHIYASNLLHGYAWEKTTSWIGTYGDLDTLLAWKFLASSLAPGSEFTHALVPSLARDVFLHGRILSRQSVRTPAGTWVRTVVCAYLIDFGVIAVTDSTGSITGYTRMFNYGSVAYADGVGPVACYERRLLTVGGASRGEGDVTLRLTGYAPGPVPAD
jgi:hypothetical protein